MANHIDTELQAFGATPASVLRFDTPEAPEHLDYLDLPRLPCPVAAVVSMAGRPVMYVTRGPIAADTLSTMCHLLAQRGAADHLGILELGCLTVVPLIRKRRAVAEPMIWRPDDVGALDRLPGLAFGTARDEAPATAQRLHTELVKLLESTTRKVVDAGVAPGDALSLVGRSLFLRFLIDRGIISDKDTASICPKASALTDAFSTPRNIAETSKWLDATFNGNLLPLDESPRRFWAKIKRPEDVCASLTLILHKADYTGQLRFQWDTLDFSHIPVGLLSQVYESWCHQFSRNQAIKDSVWYTPRAIAEYVVDEAFYGLDNPHKARVLDPAVGAGVFLVATFRELIRQRWKHDGSRPGRSDIRDILYNQLVGFDVNEASLRLTALALYLTALELDPDPRPANRLRFADLRTRGVLHDVRGPLDHEDDELPLVGSLGDHIDKSHLGAYDIVLGNPPWTSWANRIDEGDARLQARVAVVKNSISQVVADRAPPSPSEADHQAPIFEMVDYGPDVPFVWRAMQWARPNGVIALALHARLLFRQSPAGIATRNQLFTSLAISGVLNGAALAPTLVWPSHNAPFCLLFATNSVPDAEHAFTLVSPTVDTSLNSLGYIRIDADDARPIQQEKVRELPWLLKTHYRGTSMDVGVVERLMEASTITLGGYFDDNKLSCSRGFIRGNRKKKAPHLERLRDISAVREFAPVTKVRELPSFDGGGVERPRSAAEFEGPLVITWYAPRHDRNALRATLVETSVAYDDKFYAFSAAGHPLSDLLAEYLFIVLNSNVILYRALMCSGVFANSRNILQLHDLREFPFIPPERLTGPQRRRVRALVSKCKSTNVLPQAQFDSFMAELYGLSEWDQQVMLDTLDVALPFSPELRRAEAPPTSAQVAAFGATLSELLSSILEHSGRRVRVAPHVVNDAASSWRVLALRACNIDGKALAAPPVDQPLDPAIWDFARDRGASRTVVATGRPGELLLGLFAQYRYWTPTRARMLALDLLGNVLHEETLRGGAT